MPLQKPRVRIASSSNLSCTPRSVDGPRTSLLLVATSYELGKAYNPLVHLAGRVRHLCQTPTTHIYTHANTHTHTHSRHVFRYSKHHKAR
jgi:hypothetical protein